MKRNKIIYLSLILTLLYSCNSIKVEYDVVIVGGGLAGLSAAKELNSRKVLVIERDTILGGRVRTHNYENKYFYDMGASFALHPTYRKTINISDEEFDQSRDSIAIYFNNRIFSGLNPYEILINYEKSILSKNLIGSYYDKKNYLNKNEIDSSYYQLFNYFIKSVFPGSLKNYNNNILPYIFERYHSSYFKQGNANVVNYFLKDRLYKIIKSATVIDVVDYDKYVTVTYILNNNKYTLNTKKCIITTPAHITKNIIRKLNSESDSFLNSVSYAGYYSIAIGVEKDNFVPNLAYVIPYQSGFGSILMHNTQNINFKIFHLYVANEDFNYFKDTSEVRIKSINMLNKIWNVRSENIKFYDFVYWPNAGVVFDSTYIKNWTNNAIHPSKNVFLAGDYTILNSKAPPYGMISAVNSGKNAVFNLKKRKLFY